MRDSKKHAKSGGGGLGRLPLGGGPEDPAVVPFEAKTFFESVYRSNIRGEPDERMTIGGVSEMEAAFHYNSLANSIIRAIARRNPPPAPAMIEAWKMLQQRRNYRLLDIGSGTGYWIDFMRKVFFVGEAVGIEITSEMAEYLRQKYAGTDQVTILDADITDSAFDLDQIGGPVDFVTAIGVMFHIVDDALWRRAMSTLRNAVRPGGLILIGGEFGSVTRNVQFHKTDRFDSWKEHDQAQPEEKVLRVNKRVRSLADWNRVAGELNLVVVDLVRSDKEPDLLTTPENDLLVLERPAEKN